MTEFRLSLPDEVIDLIAERVADRVAARLARSTPSPWLSAPEVAERLRCSVSRIRKLTMAGELVGHRDGGRVLYRAEDVDRFVARGGASTGR